MSLERRQSNPGRREREAGKRHRRAWVVEKGNCTISANFVYFLHYPPGADATPLKLGREHSRRRLNKSLAVADRRKVKLAKGAEESGRQHQKG
jgi:hypothetical protein